MPLKCRLRIAALTAALAVPAASACAHTCTVSAVPGSFGFYDPRSGSPRDSTGTVSVGCIGLLGLTIAVNYSIALSAGNGSVTSRYMSSGTNQLRYQLYGDPARTSIWGDGTSLTSVLTQSWLVSILSPPQSARVNTATPQNSRHPRKITGWQCSAVTSLSLRLRGR